MELYIYKGFNIDFLSKLKISPLVDYDLYYKKNIFKYDKKFHRTLDIALLNMEDDDKYWITYEEYSLIKDRVNLSARDYGLKVILYINNLYPGYYPIEFEIEPSLEEEIIVKLESDANAGQSEKCEKFFDIYNSLERIENKIFVSFYNYELEKELLIYIKPYYDTVQPQYVNNIDTDLHIYITNDVPMYLKDLMKIDMKSPKSISFSCSNGIISKRNILALSAYCLYYGISLYQTPGITEKPIVSENELIKIAKNDLKINSFGSFRQLLFYKNPDIDNEVIEVSQAQIIGDIINQAERANSDKHDYRDIFITAPTGAGKSIMFQIPAVYLAKKYNKLTIVIEPVKALMQDQKEQLNSRGFVRVETFNSDLISQTEKEKVLRRVKDGEVDLLYLSPETLLSYSMETLIGDREIGLIIVDEAHIVTTWGVGFRPDYWYLGGYLYKLRNQIQTKWNKNKITKYFPICAFTATAVNGGLDDSVSETIISLCMENPIKYIGNAKRNNIKFDINVKNTERLPNNIYEQKKAIDLVNRINGWIQSNMKTIVYFPYASYAGDVINGKNCFSGRNFDTRKVAIYTGRNINNVDNETFTLQKKQAFEDFRSGRKNIMLATKAFGMGVDINNIINVYHYAVTGNLCDYVQEIGRVARKSGSIGYAITDYYYNDISFMQRLFGMSLIKQYQIHLVLSGIYNTYIRKRNNRSFLISPESFTYIFTGKESSDNEDSQISKLKTCLLMIEKDLYDKYNFKVLISRPQGIFTKSYVCIHKEYKEHVLNSEYGKYFQFIDYGRNKDPEGVFLTTTDMGDIYSLDLKALWEDHYPNISFPQFKYWYFNKNSQSEDKVDIMSSIKDEFSIREKISIETKGDFLLNEIRGKLLEDFRFIADTMYSNFKKKYFSIEDLIKVITPKYGNTRARIIANSILYLADPNGRCIKYRAHGDHASTQYTLSNGTFKELLNRTIAKSTVMRILDSNELKAISKFISIKSDGKEETALKMLSIFDYANYEVVGGEQPEIFIRLNDPEKIRRIVFNEMHYSNSYVTRAREKHEREVKILRKFFSKDLDDIQRWDFIEKYFLGYDVLAD